MRTVAAIAPVWVLSIAGCLAPEAPPSYGELEAVTAPGDGADWAQYGRTPRHTSFNPLEGLSVRASK